MPDHVPILIEPNEGVSLSRIEKGIKGPTARKINLRRGTRGQIWEDECYDRIVRSEREFDAILHYTLNNPVKGGLTNDPLHYVGWYCGKCQMTDRNTCPTAGGARSDIPL